MARRSYQRGSVFKRGKQRKVWVGRWRERVLENGEARSIQRAEILGPVSELTKAQARLRLDALLRDTNRRKPRRIVTLGEFAEQWMETVLPHYKRSTQRAYRCHLREHVIPELGEMQLDDIQPRDVQEFITRKSQQLAPLSVKNLHNVLRRLFRTAREWEYTEGNPVAGVKLPPKTRIKQKFSLTAEQVRALLAELEEPVRTMVLLAVLTGLRRGEIIGLKWKDIDLEKGLLSVAQQFQDGRFEPPKYNSFRDVPLSPEVVSALRRLRPRGPDELLFPGRKKGQPVDPAALNRWFIKPACDRAGIPRSTWKVFRDTHASLLNENGESLKVMQEQLGHQDAQTTLNVYIHNFPESRRRAVNNLESVLFPSVPKSGEIVH